MHTADEDRDASPDWMRAAVRQTVEELGLFLRTLVSFTVHPRRFTRRWIDGTGPATLNPFGFVATAAGVLGFAKTVANAVDPGPLPDAASETLVSQVLASLLPPLYFALLGTIAHGVLRLIGSRRRLRDTLAVALYAAGPALAAELVLELVATSYFWFQHRELDANPALVWPLVVPAFLAFAIPFVGALDELHAVSSARASWLRSMSAFVVALVASGFVFGAVRPPGSFGLHPVLGFRRDAAGRYTGEYGLRD